jgi:hypothetical protein
LILGSVQAMAMAAAGARILYAAAAKAPSSAEAIYQTEVVDVAAGAA